MERGVYIQQVKTRLARSREKIIINKNLRLASLKEKIIIYECSRCIKGGCLLNRYPGSLGGALSPTGNTMKNNNNKLVLDIIKNDATNKAKANGQSVVRIVFGCDAVDNRHLSTQYMTVEQHFFAIKAEERQGIYDKTAIYDMDCIVYVFEDKRYGLTVYYVYLDPNGCTVPITTDEDSASYLDTHTSIASYEDGKDTPIDIYVSPYPMEAKVEEMNKVLGMGTIQGDSVVYRLHAARRTVVVTRGKKAS